MVQCLFLSFSLSLSFFFLLGDLDRDRLGRVGLDRPRDRDLDRRRLLLPGLFDRPLAEFCLSREGSGVGDRFCRDA